MKMLDTDMDFPGEFPIRVYQRLSIVSLFFRGFRVVRGEQIPLFSVHFL